MDRKRRSLSASEIGILNKMNGKGFPDEANIDFFLECVNLKPFYSVAKRLGLIPSNIKKWADSREGRYEEMGVYTIGAKPKLYVNVSQFTRWALENPQTRRYLIYQFNKEICPVPKNSTPEEVAASGKIFILKDLCKAGIIPQPFSTKNGVDTLIEHARNTALSRSKMGLWFDEKFKTWLAEPAALLLFILKEYNLAKVELPTS
jgi:hypothetical protein